jgi:hypothetical protein
VGALSRVGHRCRDLRPRVPAVLVAAAPGNDQRYTAPGIGFIVGNTGLSIVTIDNATGEVLSVDKLAGHQDGTPFPALCVGLE